MIEGPGGCEVAGQERALSLSQDVGPLKSLQGTRLFRNWMFFSNCSGNWSLDPQISGDDVHFSHERRASERSSEREREIDRERETERATERERARQRESARERDRERARESETERERERARERESARERDRERAVTLLASRRGISRRSAAEYEGSVIL
jgi:hypothetical protein